MRTIITLLLLFFSQDLIFSQKENSRKSIANSKKAEAILDKSHNPQKEIDSLIKAYKQSEKNITKHNLAFAIGEKLWFARNTTMAEKWLLLSIGHEPKATNINNITNALDLLTNLYLHTGKIEEAVSYSEKCYTAYTQVSNKKFLGNYYQTKGRIYHHLGENNASINAFMKADSLYSISKFADVKANAKYVDLVLAETFFNFKQYEKAIEYYNLVISKSKETKSTSGENLGMQGLAKCAFQQNEYDKANAIYLNLISKATSPSTLLYTYVGLGDIGDAQKSYQNALNHYQNALIMAKKNNESYMFDILHSKIGNIYLKMNDLPNAKTNIDSALVLTKRYNNLNSQINAYITLIDIYKKEKKYDSALLINEKLGVVKDQLFNKNTLETANKFYIVNKIKQKDLEISVLKKTDDLNKKYLKQSDLIKLLLGLIIAIMGLLFYNFYKKIKATKLAEEYKTIQIERERIITDLHDDIGATLSSMQIFGDLATNIWETKPEESKKMVAKISETSKDLMTRMGDIIWSMKPADEEKFTLQARVRNYTNELLSPKNIVCKIEIDEKIANKITNPDVRKNLLLIIKEGINNISKYSQATKAIIGFNEVNHELILTISDNGIGYEKSEKKSGNGVENMALRCKQINGFFEINTKSGAGVEIICHFSFAIIS